MLLFRYSNYLADSIRADCGIDISRDDILATLSIDGVKQNGGWSFIYTGVVLVERLYPTKSKFADIDFRIEHIFTEPNTIKCTSQITSEYPEGNLDYGKIRSYFPDDVETDEIEETIIRLLEQWNNNKEC